MRRVSISTGVVAIGLLLSCGEPSPPVTPPPPLPIASATSAPTADAAPTATEAASAAPAAPPVARKECSKTTAMVSPTEPFWHVLAQPGSCWTLAPAEGDPARDLVIEAYDVRQVGDAEVARLRVTYNGPNGPEDLSERDPWPQQVAFTPKGVWFVGRKADDKAVDAAVAKPPSYAIAARPMEPTKASKWRFIRKGKSVKGDVVCFGFEIPKDECKGGPCASSLCVAHTGGFIQADGAASPTGAVFAQRGVKIEPLDKGDAADAKKPTPAKKP